MSVLLLILQFISNYFKMLQSVTTVSIKLFFFRMNYFVILPLIYHFWDFRSFSDVKNYGSLRIHDVYILDTEKAGITCYSFFSFKVNLISSACNVFIIISSVPISNGILFKTYAICSFPLWSSLTFFINSIAPFLS